MVIGTCKVQHYRQNIASRAETNPPASRGHHFYEDPLLAHTKRAQRALPYSVRQIMARIWTQTAQIWTQTAQAAHIWTHTAQTAHPADFNQSWFGSWCRLFCMTDFRFPVSSIPPPPLVSKHGDEGARSIKAQYTVSSSERQNRLTLTSKINR